MALGVGLRFVHLPDFMLPIAVGVAVSAAVILALRVLAATPDAAPKPVRRRRPAARAKSEEGGECGGRKDASARLAAMTRSSPSGSYRRPRKQ